jgi:dinuclear metal center YbgI/SA1388 family protein
MTTFSEVEQLFAEIAPISLAEGYDNVGLLVGSPSTEVTGVLTCLEVTEEVLDEAIENGFNLIVAHHPILFKGIKRLTGKGYVEKILLKAIKADIGIIAVHTNIDNAENGVSYQLAELLGLQGIEVLQPIAGKLGMLTTFSPVAGVPKILDALFTAGAGHIGKYAECAFRLNGLGSFKPLEGSKPKVGKIDELSLVQEQRLELIYPIYLEKKIFEALKGNHEFEEVAYYCTPTNNIWRQIGAGAIGELITPEPLSKVLDRIKKSLGIEHLRYSSPKKFETDLISKIAVGGGTCSFLIGPAKAAKADLLLTSDLKYHEWFEAEDALSLVDVGHYESEIHIAQHFANFIRKKMPNIAVRLTTVTTNPVKHH